MALVPRDLRTAVRALARKPGVTVLAITSLALAIGFSTAAFSVLDAYEFRDVAVSQPERLARVYSLTREQRGDGLNWYEYQALASRARSFVGIATEDRQGPKVRLPDRDDFPITAGVSDNFFDLLGINAARGTVFHAGQGRDETLVITHRYWKDMLGSDPNVIGRSLPVGSALLHIIGVLPPGFQGVNRGLLVDLYVPSQTFFGALRASRADEIRDTSHEPLARLRPGVTLAQARAECEAILRQVEQDGRAPGPGRKAILDNFTETGLWSKVQSNAVMLGIVVLLVLIAAANLANLRLVENESRRHETGIRLALGAKFGDLARQHLAETLLLGGVSTACGLLLARWLISLAPALFYAGTRYTDYGIRLDARAFAFSSAALLAVALIGAAIPLSDAWRRRIMPALYGGNRTTRSSRWLGVLVVTQMALVTGVTCSAGLLWRSLEKISEIRPAMDPDRRLLLVSGYFTAPPAEVASRAGTLASGIGSLPGVERVAWARRVMLWGSGGGGIVDFEAPGQGKLSFPYNSVSSGYFATTGARVLSGRPFSDSDSAEATPVVMVNSTFVRRFFEGREPLGQWVRVAGKDRQIVGVVEDGPQNHLREKIAPFFYFPFTQLPVRSLMLMIATPKDPGLLADEVRRQIRGADKAFTLTWMLTMGQHMRAARSSQQLGAEITGTLAAVGLLLAAAGLFGVTLFAVTRRTPEFGVRVAMGATPGRVARQVLREAGIRVAIAIPLGWILAYAGRHAIEKLLYGVAADDPWTFAAAAAVVAVVGAVAALHPAIRAARIDPMAALRHE